MNGNRSNQESKFDFLASWQCLVKIDKGQQKIKIVRSNRQSNLWVSCQSIFSLFQHHPTAPVTTTNQQGVLFAHQLMIPTPPPLATPPTPASSAVGGLGGGAWCLRQHASWASAMAIDLLLFPSVVASYELSPVFSQNQP